mgnify:CR=1 FL=1
MQNPLITLALSVYNVESYLCQSLATIVNQTYKNLEILCIDDCSNDKTLQILKKFATKDSRFKIIRQPSNQGLSASRNIAIEKAQGEYIIMLDGDDLFAHDMVEKAYSKIEETGADLVMWDYCTFYKEEELPRLLQTPSSLIGFDASNKVALLQRPAFTCLKLVRTQVLRDLHVHFPDGLTKQDIPIWWHLATSIDKIAILPERLSYYRQSPYNTTSRKDKSVYSLAYVMDITGEYLKNNALYDTYKEIFQYQRLSLLHGMYDHIKTELKSDAMRIIQERMDEDAIAYINSPRCMLSKRTKFFYKGFFRGSFLAKILYDVFIFSRHIYRRIICQNNVK